MDTSLFHGNLVKSNRIIYTPSDFAKTNLLHLQEVGQLQAQKPHRNERSNLTSFLFFIVKNGSGSLDYNKEHFSLKKGDCIFIDCSKPYAHHSSENLWTLQWVHFYGPNLSAIYEKYKERGGLSVFSTKGFSSYEKLLAEIYLLASSTEYIKDMKIYEKLTGLLTLLMEESWNPEKNAYNPVGKQNLQAMKEYLDQNYAQKFSLDELADMFFINKYYLTRVFKKQFGLSITNYLLQIRITHAKQLLRFSDFSIEKIGADCGMSDPNYFSRMFKKVEGISPGEFRKLW